MCFTGTGTGSQQQLAGGGQATGLQVVKSTVFHVLAKGKHSD